MVAPALHARHQTAPGRLQSHLGLSRSDVGTWAKPGGRKPRREPPSTPHFASSPKKQTAGELPLLMGLSGYSMPAALAKTRQPVQTSEARHIFIPTAFPGLSVSRSKNQLASSLLHIDLRPRQRNNTTRGRSGAGTLFFSFSFSGTRGWSPHKMAHVDAVLESNLVWHPKMESYISYNSASSENAPRSLSAMVQRNPCRSDLPHSFKPSTESESPRLSLLVVSLPP